MVLPAVAALLVYANTLGAEFVYDDDHQIVQNPWVQDVRHIPRLLSTPVWAFRTTEPTNYYRPVQMLAYNLLWNASEGDPLPFHLLNIILHALTASAVAALVYRLQKNAALAGASGLVFAVHPVNTEAVAWIACLPELTYALFVVTSLILHASSWTATGGGRRLRRGLALIAFALALFSKETAVVSVGLVFLLESWLRPSRAEGGSTGGSPRKGSRTRPSRLGTAIRATLPYVAVSAGYIAVHWVVVGGLAPRAREGLTALDAVVNAPSLVFSYFRVMLFPVGLQAHHVFTPLPSPFHPLFALGAAGVVALIAAAAWLSRVRPHAAFALSLAFLPLLPVLYVPAIGANAFAERYAYLAAAGVAWLFATALTEAAKRLAPGSIRAMTVGVLAPVVVGLGAASAVRNLDWRDDRRLATATLEAEPRATFMYVVLGNWYERHDQPEKALSVYEEGLRISPDSYFLRGAVVTARLGLHRIGPDEASSEFRALTEKHPRFFSVWVNLGAALVKAGRPEEAESAYGRALELNPNDPRARDGLRLARIAQGRVEPDSSGAPVHPPDSVSARATEKRIEGIAHARAGRLDEAEAALRDALRLEPRSTKALTMLGVVKARQGDDRAAIEYCREATEIDPEFVDAYRQMGISAIRLGETQRAIQALERAVAIAPSDKRARNELGRAYAVAGRLADARREWLRSLEIDPRFESARRNLEMLEQAVSADDR